MRAYASFAAAAQLVVAIMLAQGEAAGAAEITLSQGCGFLNSSVFDNTYNNQTFTPALSFSNGDTITFTASDGSGTTPPPVMMIRLVVVPTTGPAVTIDMVFTPPTASTLTYTFGPIGNVATATWLVGYDPGSGFVQWLAYSPAWEVSCAAGPPVASCNGLPATIFVGSDGKIVSPDPNENGKTFAGVLHGTNGDDVIVGTNGNDLIKGFAGNDTICGLGGNDAIQAGPGDDWVDGGDGNDLIKGQEGDDTLLGGNGNDFIEGGPGNDCIDGGPGNDDLAGQDGDDDIAGGSGTNFIDGGPGANVIFSTSPTDHIKGPHVLGPVVCQPQP